MKSLSIAHIRTNGDTQPRVQLNEEAVADYAEALREGATLPPVTVYFDGSDYWLADGFHRFHAHRAIDAATIAADVREGTRRDAVLHSVGANAAHGLRRTNEDKRRAVETLLNDEEWSTWSNNQIAKACGVNDKTVAAVRAAIFGNSEDAPTVRTVERNGTTYQQNVAKIGPAAQQFDEPTAEPAPASASLDETPDPDEPERPEDEGPDLAAMLAEAVEDNESMARVFEANDQLAAAVAEAKRYREVNRLLEERIRGLMNEKAEAVRLAKHWKRQYEKLERQRGAA